VDYVWLSHHIIVDIGLEADLTLVEEEKLKDPLCRCVQVLCAILHQVLKEVFISGIDNELGAE
jgi:hypothetical protein